MAGRRSAVYGGGIALLCDDGVLSWEADLFCGRSNDLLLTLLARLPLARRRMEQLSRRAPWTLCRLSLERLSVKHTMRE
jgi:hypothetical protein